MKNLSIDEVNTMSAEQFENLHEIQFKDVLLDRINEIVNSSDYSRGTRVQNIKALNLLEEIIRVKKRSSEYAFKGCYLSGKLKEENDANMKNCFDCEKTYKLELIALITQL